MAYQLDTERLAVLVRTKRAGRGLRELAEEIGEVSPSTLSRLENGKTPDMTVFLRVCDWLQIPPAELLIDEGSLVANEPEGTAEQIDILLRSDKTLDPATANALAAIIKATYNNLPKLPLTS
ncbi:helix-turn-helix domain-containing protein [Spirosoma litoris]